MSFRINTNVNALNAQAQATFNNMNLQKSLERLSSGLQINKAADDASGMTIADSLRNQANALNQSIRNANDGQGIIQIADKAMDEQIKIVDTVKVKATQAAQDGQTSETRKAIQADINRLLEGLDNIASTTSFNGQALLSGSFTNKEFQVGAYSNTTVKASILATSTDKIGHVRFESTDVVGGQGDLSLKFTKVDGKNDITLETVSISTSAGTGIGVLAEVINKNSDRLNAKATWQNQVTNSGSVGSGDVTGLVINDVTIGSVTDVKTMDSDGKLVAAFNKVTDQTGVEASIDVLGRLNLRSTDGRGIDVTGTGFDTVGGNASSNVESYGKLTLIRLDARDITVSGSIANATNSVTLASWTPSNESTINLRTARGSFSADQSKAIGGFANTTLSADASGNGIGAGVTTLRGAMAIMDIADSAIKTLDKIRADLGSVSNQLTSTINNITITAVNVQSAESTIRDVDFASESANFSKYNILAQSGSFAMSQASITQQNVLNLLQ